MNFTKMCRCCMKIENILMPMNFLIFSTTYTNSTIGDIYNILLMNKLKFTESDGFPENICLPCLKQLNSSYEFYLKCLDSYKQMSQTITATTNIFNNIICAEGYFGIIEGTTNLTVVVNNNNNNNNNEIINEKTLINNKEEPNQLENNYGMRLIKPKPNLLINNIQEIKTENKNVLSLDLEKNSEIEKNSKPKKLIGKLIKKHICSICQRSFFTKKGMASHQVNHKETTQILSPIKCILCNMEFKKKLSIVRHMKHHKKNVCFYCNSGFLNQTDIILHVQKVHAERNFPCFYCNKNFKLRKLLLRHQRDVHKVKKNLFYCGICENNNKVGYIALIYLQRHIQKYHLLINNTDSNEINHNDAGDENVVEDDAVELEVEQQIQDNIAFSADEITITTENLIDEVVVEEYDNDKVQEHEYEEEYSKEDEENKSADTTIDILDNFVNEESANINLSSFENVTYIEPEFYLNNNENISISQCIDVEFLDEVINDNNMLEYFLPKEDNKSQDDQLINDTTTTTSNVTNLKTIENNTSSAITIKDEIKKIEESELINKGMVRINYLTNSIEQIQSNIIYQKGDCNETNEQIENNNLPERYKCPRCSDPEIKLFKTQFNLMKHLAHDHNEMSFICNECGLKFNRIDKWELHRKEHLKDNFDIYKINLIEENNNNSSISNVDGNIDDTLNYLEYEKIEKNGINLYNCKLCDKTFQRKINLQKHNCNYYKNTNIQVQCTFCKETFTSARKMCIHRKTHIMDKILCSLCDKKFKTFAGLKYHLKTHLNTHGIKAFECLYCNKKFTANTNLNAHIKIVHSIVKPYQCLFCDKKFATNDHLKKHVNHHHLNLRTFICKICGKGFLQNSHLSGHMLCHSNIKGFECNYCIAKYTTKSSLKKHLLEKHEIILS